MKVKMYAADRGGCGHYRILWPGHAARMEGLDVETFDDSSGTRSTVGAICVDTDAGGRTVIDVADPEADVVVLQRPLARELVATIPFMQARGVAVVVEVDDDFHSIHPHNAARHASDPAKNPEMNRDWLMLACKMADLVTTTTTALADRYARHGRFAVIPNMLPDHAFDPRPLERPDGFWLGWTGSISTHPDDLQTTDREVGFALRRTGTGMYVVGDGRGVREALAIHDATPWHCTGWTPIDEYHARMACMDVGIVPLADTDFNHAKSWLKGLEMAAAGVPFIATATPQYRLLTDLGAGIPVEKPRQWAGALKSLLTSPERRADVAGRARHAVDNLRYSRQVEAWHDAWTVALVNHRLRRHVDEYGIRLPTRNPWKRIIRDDDTTVLVEPLP